MVSRVSMLVSLSLLVAALTACVQRSESMANMQTVGADIVVTAASPAAPIATGEGAEFAIRVVNAGPHDADDVRIVDTVGAQSQLVSVTCSASAGAECPKDLGLSMVVPRLPNGGGLDFRVTLKLADANATGNILNSAVATYALDGDPNNNAVAMDAVVR